MGEQGCIWFGYKNKKNDSFYSICLKGKFCMKEDVKFNGKN